MGLNIFITIGIVILAIPAAIIIFILIRPKTNIRYVITQTFFGGERIVIKEGKVESKIEDKNMAVHKMLVGTFKLVSIGTFHQKHLRQGIGNKLVMKLEEYDVGRYRPVKMGDLSDTDPDGLNVKVENPISNNDIDFIVNEKSAAKETYEKKKEEKMKWLPYVAGVAVFIICFIVFVLMMYYVNEMNTKLVSLEIALEQKIDGMDPVNMAKAMTNNCVDLMRNGTVIIQTKTNASELPPHFNPMSNIIAGIGG